MSANVEQVKSLKEMLGICSLSTWLKINFHKSSIILVSVEEIQLQQIAHCLGCMIGALPFTYLGLDVETSRPKISDLTPVIVRL